MEDFIKGRLGGADGYNILCSIEGDTISGRVGGKIYGKDIVIEIGEQGVKGSIGGEAIDMLLASGVLKGTVGGQTLVLRGVDKVTGYLGEPILGWSIFAQQNGDRLTGQLGSAMLGKLFTIELGSTPGWIGALIAVISFYGLEPRAKA